MHRATPSVGVASTEDAFAFARCGESRSEEDERESASRASPFRSERSRESALEALARELDETESLLSARRARGGRAGGRATRAGVTSSVRADAREDEESARFDDVDAFGEGERARDGGGASTERLRGSMTPRARWSAATIVACACACALALTSGGGGVESRARRHLHLSSLTEMQCESAFVPARAREAEADTAVNRMIAAAEHVYVLTAENCASPNVTLRVPKEYAEKTTCVSGRWLDRCTSQATGVWWESHYTRVSMAHGMMIKHAKEHGFRSIAIMEEDATINHDVSIHADTESDMVKLLTEDFDDGTSSLGRVELDMDESGLRVPWNLVRPAFRPHIFEKFEARKQGRGWIEVTTGVKEDMTCPSQCKCTNTREGGQLCALADAGCDLRSSDMYFLHSRAYGTLLDMLFIGTDETIIDHFVLQNIPKTWILHPSLTVQAHLDISDALQLRVQDAFEKSCVR